MGERSLKLMLFGIALICFGGLHGVESRDQHKLALHFSHVRGLNCHRGRGIDEIREVNKQD